MLKNKKMLFILALALLYLIAKIYVSQTPTPKDDAVLEAVTDEVIDYYTDN